jgi:excisionase family DNA binding protein
MSTDAPCALITVSEAARRLGVDPRHLARAVRAGDLAAFRLGSRSCYVEWGAVLTWLRDRQAIAAIRDDATNQQS